MKDYVKQVIDRFANSSCDELTKNEVQQWLTDEEHADEKNAALYDVWQKTSGDKDYEVYNSLNAVYRKVGVSVDYSWKKQIHLSSFVRYAAAVTLLVIVSSITFFATKSQYSEIAMVENYTRFGEMLTIKLPDGSEVQTNSGTLLLYPEKFTGDTRTVFLLGEANFKVKPDPAKPFIVRSNTMSVTALGTEFNVSSYSEKSEVVATLIEGKVKVVCGLNGENYILHPGQQVSYSKNSGQSHLSHVDIDDVTAWKRGVLVFRSVTVQEMIMTLQRKYNVVVEYHENRFNNDKYNFRFSEKASLEEVLAIMKEIVGDFKHSIRGNHCKIE